MMVTHPEHCGYLATLLAVWLGATVSFAADANEPTKDPNAIRVMTFNIRYGTAADGPNRWDQRKDLVTQVIRHHRPDLLGLQEALRFQIDFIREALPAYEEIGVGREDGKTKGEYSAILYHTARIRVFASGYFWLSDTPEIPNSMTWGNQWTRIVTWAQLLDRKTGRRVAVYNTHWDHQSQHSRIKSAELIIQRMQRHSDAHAIILMGDMNADETNPAITLLKTCTLQVLKQDGSPQDVNLVDTFRIQHPDAGEVGTFNAFTGDRTGGNIDYVFVSDNISVLDARILHDNDDGRYPSDHFPVMADLKSDTKF